MMDKYELVFQIIQSTGIILSFLLTVYTLRINQKHLKASNSLLITQHHRELWSTIYETEDLKRVFQRNVNLIEEPVTEREFTFTNMIFLHMSGCLKLSKTKSCFAIEGMENDIKDILSYPIPNYVWLQVYRFHDKDFIDFVARNIN